MPEREETMKVLFLCLPPLHTCTPILMKCCELWPSAPMVDIVRVPLHDVTQWDISISEDTKHMTGDACAKDGLDRAWKRKRAQEPDRRS